MIEDGHPDLGCPELKFLPRGDAGAFTQMMGEAMLALPALRPTWASWGPLERAWTTGLYALMDKTIAARGSATTLRGGIRLFAGETANPVGTGNGKVAGPSTYRPVGATCPACPYLKGCYASGGNVRMHSVRATESVAASLASVVVGVFMARKARSLVRLHTSGDFYRDGELDTVYLRGLEHLGLLTGADPSPIRTRRVAGAWAWTYTHVEVAEFEPWRPRLEAAGIVVNYSDLLDSGGAVVWPHDQLEALTELLPEGVTALACPAQTIGLSCNTCGACNRLRSARRVVVFDPHGSGQAAAEAASLALHGCTPA